MHNGRVGLITGVSNPTQEQNIDDSISVLRWIQRWVQGWFSMFSMIGIGRRDPALYFHPPQGSRKKVFRHKTQKVFFNFSLFCNFHDKNIYRFMQFFRQFFILFHRIYFIWVVGYMYRYWVGFAHPVPLSLCLWHAVRGL